MWLPEAWRKSSPSFLLANTMSNRSKAESTGGPLIDGEVAPPKLGGDSKRKGMNTNPSRKRKAPFNRNQQEGKGNGGKKQRKDKKPVPAGPKGDKRSLPVSKSKKSESKVTSMLDALQDQCAKELAKMDVAEEEEEQPVFSFKPGFHQSWDSFIKLIGPLPTARMQPAGSWGDSLLRYILGSDPESVDQMYIGYNGDSHRDPAFEAATYWLVTRPFYLETTDVYPNHDGDSLDLVVYWDHIFQPIRDGMLDRWMPVCYSSEWVLFARDDLDGPSVPLPPIYPRWKEIMLDNKDLDLMTGLHARVLRNGRSGLYRDINAVPGFSFTLSLNRFYPLVQDIVKRNSGCIWTVPTANYAIASGLLYESVMISDNASSNFLTSVQLGRRAVGDFFKLFPARTFQLINAVAGAATDLGGAVHDRVRNGMVEEVAEQVEQEQPVVEDAVILEAPIEVTADYLEKMEEIQNSGPIEPEAEEPKLRAFFGGLVNSLVSFTTSIPMPQLSAPVAPANLLERIPFNSPGGDVSLHGDLFSWTTIDAVKGPDGKVVDHTTFLETYEMSVEAIKHGAVPVYPIDINCEPKYVRSELSMFEAKIARKSWYAWEGLHYFFPSNCDIVKICTYINRCCLTVPARKSSLKVNKHHWYAVDDLHHPFVVDGEPKITGYPDDLSLRKAMVSNMPARAQKIRLQPFEVSEDSSKHEFCVKLDESLANPKPRGLVNVGNKSFWDSRSYVKHCTDQLNRIRAFVTVFRIQESARKFSYMHLCFSYGAEMSPDEKSAWRRWVDRYLERTKIKYAIFTLAGGDDTATLVWLNGKMIQIEKDLSMCDQSHDLLSVKFCYHVLVSLGLLSRDHAGKFCQLIDKDFRLRFDVGNKRRPFLPTGIGPTSLFNTLVVGLEELLGAADVVGKMLHMSAPPKKNLLKYLETEIIAIHTRLGRNVKVKVTDNPNLLTFHKGAWIGPDYIWTPLPSRCWKFGVVPASIGDDDVNVFVADVAWSWSTSVLDPIFAAFISPHLARARVLHAPDAALSIMDEAISEAPAWFEFGSNKLVRADRPPLTVEYCTSFYYDRYGLSISDVYAIIEEVRSLDAGHVFPSDHKLMDILAVDLLETRGFGPLSQ